MEIGALAFKYWIEFLFGVMATLMTTGFVWIWRRFRRFQKEQDSVRNGVRALLRDRIIQAYNHYTEKGFCPIYGLENVHSMHSEYRSLGGNGAVSQLVKELEALPRSPTNERSVST